MERLIHRIWIGSEMPDDYRRFGELWEQLNPDWTLIDWTEEELLDERWENQNVIDNLYWRDRGRRSTELFAQLADVLDYELLYRYGGVYVNADIEPVRPLDVLDLRKPWVAREDPRYVVNAAMFSPVPRHWFYESVIESLRARYWSNPSGPMNQTTGPHLLTDVFNMWTKRSPGGVVAHHVDVWNPRHWKEVPKGGTAARRVTPVTVGIHHWGHRRDGRTNTIPEE